jgi:hypothetical protein
MKRCYLFCICWLGNFDNAMFFIRNSRWVLLSIVPQNTINDLSSAAHCILATSLENLHLTLLNVLSYRTSFRTNGRFINHLIFFVHCMFAAKSHKVVFFFLRDHPMEPWYLNQWTHRTFSMFMDHYMFCWYKWDPFSSNHFKGTYIFKQKPMYFLLKHSHWKMQIFSMRTW